MLCAGVVHGDLSEFNILLAADGPVIIDLPQAVDAAGNNHARRMLLRDVTNLRDFFGRFAPALLATDYGPEIWDLYERGLLAPDQPLTGRFEQVLGAVDLEGVMEVIDDVQLEEAARKMRQTADQWRGQSPAAARAELSSPADAAAGSCRRPSADKAAPRPRTRTPS
jgi:RIO kinase 1